MRDKKEIIFDADYPYDSFYIDCGDTTFHVTNDHGLLRISTVETEVDGMPCMAGMFIIPEAGNVIKLGGRI